MTLLWGLIHDVQSVLARLHPFFSNDGLPHWFQDFQRPASDVLARALAWIEEDDPRPWFCFVNMYDVHWPYVPRGAGRELVGDYDGPLGGYLFRADDWKRGTEITAEDRRHVTELYEGELFDLDREVDAFLSALGLEQGGTAVLVTSDHGRGLRRGGALEARGRGRAPGPHPLHPSPARAEPGGPAHRGARERHRRRPDPAGAGRDRGTGRGRGP